MHLVRVAVGVQPEGAAPTGVLATLRARHGDAKDTLLCLERCQRPGQQRLSGTLPERQAVCTAMGGVAAAAPANDLLDEPPVMVDVEVPEAWVQPEAADGLPGAMRPYVQVTISDAGRVVVRGAPTWLL
jgi:hypothetical protein